MGDVAASGALVGAAAIVNLASLMVFARSLGPTSFGLFSTARRIVAFVAPFTSFGTHLGVSRYLGFYSKEARRRTAILALAALLCALALPATVAIFLPLQASVLSVGWIQELGASIWIATGALTATTSAGLIVFSTLRGFGHPQVANLHQLVVLTAFLIIGVISRQKSVSHLLYLFTAASLLANGCFIAWTIKRHSSELVRPSWKELKSLSRELARYSLPRLADGPLQASLSLICVVLAPGVGGLALSGYIHMSQTVVRMTEILIVPLSVIFLPLVAQYVREGRVNDLRRQAQLIYDGVVLAGCLAVVQGIVWAEPFLIAAVGQSYAEAMPYLRVTLPAILPFLLFAGFRSYIDGYSVRPVNLVNLAAASMCVLGGSFVFGSWRNGVGLSLAYTAGMCVLGTLSVAYVVRHFHVTIFSRHTLTSATLAIATAFVSFPIAHVVTGAGMLLVIAGAVGALLLSTSLWIWGAYQSGNPTMRYVVERVRRARVSSASYDSSSECLGSLDAQEELAQTSTFLRADMSGARR